MISYQNKMANVFSILMLLWLPTCVLGGWASRCVRPSADALAELQELLRSPPERLSLEMAREELALALSEF